MKNLGLVDGQGYGWRKIVKELESRSLPAPEIKIRKNSITVTIWFEKPLKLLSLDQRNGLFAYRAEISAQRAGE